MSKAAAVLYVCDACDVQLYGRHGLPAGWHEINVVGHMWENEPFGHLCPGCVNEFQNRVASWFSVLGIEVKYCLLPDSGVLHIGSANLVRPRIAKPSIECVE